MSKVSNSIGPIGTNVDQNVLQVDLEKKKTRKNSIKTGRETD